VPESPAFRDSAFHSFESGEKDFVGPIRFRGSKSFGWWVGRPLSSGFHFTPEFSEGQKFVSLWTGGEMMDGAEEG